MYIYIYYTYRTIHSPVVDTTTPRQRTCQNALSPSVGVGFRFTHCCAVLCCVVRHALVPTHAYIYIYIYIYVHVYICLSVQFFINEKIYINMHFRSMISHASFLIYPYPFNSLTHFLPSLVPSFPSFLPSFPSFVYCVLGGCTSDSYGRIPMAFQRSASLRRSRD